MVYARYSGFLFYLQLASHELATIGINVTKSEIQIQIQGEIRRRLLDLLVPGSADQSGMVPTEK